MASILSLIIQKLEINTEKSKQCETEVSDK